MKSWKLQIGLILFISLFGCNNSTQYGFSVLDISDMNPELAALVTTFFDPPEDIIDGMSRKSYEKRAQRAHAFLRKLETEIDYQALGTSDQVDYDFFKAQLDNSLMMIEDLRRWEIDPEMYLPFDGFFAPSVDADRPWKERFEDMTSAMENDVIQFTWGMENLKKPPLFWTEKAIQSCDYIALYFDQTLPGIIEKAPNESLKQRMTAAAADYRNHLTKYRRFLDTKLRARSTGAYAVGENHYKRLLKNYFMDYTIDEMIAIGEREIEKNTRLLEETARKIEPSKTWVELLQENTMDHVAPWQLFEDLKKEALRARKLVYERVVYMPDGIKEEYRYAAAPHYNTLAQGQSGIGPWIFTGEKYIGYFAIPYIDQYETIDRKSLFMRDWNRSWYIAQHIPHEVYPGHHFHIFMQGKNQRPARKLAGTAPFTYTNAMFSEGWSVYSEEVMADLGYFQGDLRMYLAHLGHRMWRIARIVIDPQIHARGMTYKEAHRFFMSLGLTTGQAHVETLQATKSPAHDATYYLGKLEVMALREDYKEMMGAEYDIKRFHTEFLLRGGIPPKLLRREMLVETDR